MRNTNVVSTSMRPLMTNTTRDSHLLTSLKETWTSYSLSTSVSLLRRWKLNTLQTLLRTAIKTSISVIPSQTMNKLLFVKNSRDKKSSVDSIECTPTLETQVITFIYHHYWLIYCNIARFKYQDCIVAANNNAERALSCITDYVKQIGDDNLVIVENFKKDYAKYIWATADLCLAINREIVLFIHLFWR